MGANNGNRVLRMVVIDSDRLTRVNLREQLSAMGVRVVNESEELNAGLRLARGLHPDAVCLEMLEDATETTLEAIRMFRKEHPDTGILVSSTVSSPQLILDCIRAGANEFIGRPIDGEELSKSISHLSSVSRQRTTTRREHGTVIAVFGSKGGVGATSCVANLGVALDQRSEGKTVLVDLSFHMGDLGLILDQTPRYGLTDALENGRLDAPKLQSVISKHPTGIDILTCVTSPELSDELTVDNISEAIGTLSTMYDNVIIDVGRHLDDRTAETLELSDEILLMVSQDVTTVRNVSRYLDIFERLELAQEKVHLVVNRFSKRSRIPLKDIESALGMETFWSIPNDYEPMSHALDAGVPAVIDAPRSKVAQSFKDLVELIKARREEQTASDALVPTAG